MPFTNAAEVDFLDSMFTVLGTTLYVGLSSTTPTDTGTNVTEPSSGGYARQPITTAEFAAASGANPSTKATDTAIDFGTASGTWLSGADLTHFTIHDAVSAGNVLGFGALTTAKPVMNGDPVSIPIGDLIVRFGKPTDSFP